MTECIITAENDNLDACLHGVDGDLGIRECLHHCSCPAEYES